MYVIMIILSLFWRLRGQKITPALEGQNWVNFEGVRVCTQIRENDDPEVWFVSEKDKDIRSVTDRSILKGKTITIEGQFADPIPALEAVTKGAWVILDTDKSKIDESDRFGAISSLVDFVASGASSNSPLLLGGVGSLLSGELGGLGDATQVSAVVGVALVPVNWVVVVGKVCRACTKDTFYFRDSY